MIGSVTISMFCSSVCRFWWAQQENDRKMHLLSKETLCTSKENGGLGFRDLHLFNLAMLARQGWRILTNPESLCARVLGAKYFPDDDLLKVQERPGISYSWRSIVRGMQALKTGLIWRVGDGSQINIWLDPWVPDGVTRRPITPRGHTLMTRVSELINPTTGDWDHQLIVFWEEDWERILGIPVKPGMDDLLAWHLDKKGIFFSVKSDYHVLVDNKKREARRQQGEGSSRSVQASDTEFKWKKIRKLSCQPKVKHILWRFTQIVCLFARISAGVVWTLTLGVRSSGDWMRMGGTVFSSASMLNFVGGL
jgi:hypothetical protein